MSKPDIPPPPPKPRTNRAQFMGLPAAQEASTGLSAPDPTRSADLNFKVTEDFHRAFKGAATHKGISMKILLEEAFRLWCQDNNMPVAGSIDAGIRQERARGRSQR